MVCSDLSIRKMCLDDLPIVMENEEQAYPIPWSKIVFQESISGRNDCQVFKQGEKIIGHSVSSQVVDEYHLLNLCVAPEYAGRGYGRFFLRKLIETAESLNCSVFFLEVRESNIAAISLYQTEGFNEVGVRPNYYPAKDGREDAVLMTLQLKL